MCIKAESMHSIHSYLCQNTNAEFFCYHTLDMELNTELLLHKKTSIILINLKKLIRIIQKLKPPRTHNS